MSNKRGDEWYTPKSLVEALGEFDLDPATPRHGHWTAKKCYTQAENGLVQPWNGRVILNPPYKHIDPWIYRIVDHGNGILLVFVRTGTKWMDQAMCSASGVCFLDGRIKFVDINGEGTKAAATPSMLLAFGENNVDAIASALVEGKISGRLFREEKPHDLLESNDDAIYDASHSVSNPTDEEIERWGEEIAAMQDASPFIKWRGAQEAYINGLRV